MIKKITTSIVRMLRIESSLRPSASVLFEEFCRYYQPGDSAQINMCMTIYVNELSGKVFTISVTPSQTILQVKELIVQQNGVPLSAQSLIFRNKSLEDQRTISDYN